MFQLKRILFPVDYSDRARAATAHAQALAAHFDAELILLYAVEPPGYNTALSDSHRIHAEGFDDFFGDSLKRFRTERLIEHGEPARTIVGCATRNHADLIMIPTQGMGAYRRLIIGSTTAKVLHDADCPVWTSVHLGQIPSAETIRYNQICCAVDLMAHSANVLDWANRFATSYKAELILVHAGECSTGNKEALAELQEKVGAKGFVRLQNGEPDKVVAHVAAEKRADLLVIGRGAESGRLGRLVATAYGIIRQSPCPVVSV